MPTSAPPPLKSQPSPFLPVLLSLVLISFALQSVGKVRCGSLRRLLQGRLGRDEYLLVLMFLVFICLF